MTPPRRAIEKRFQEVFGAAPTLVVRAPGRVNLIGEHTDYNDGFVLPAAIDRGVLMAVAPRRDRRVAVHALDLAASAEFSLDAITPDDQAPWSNYQRAVADVLQARGHRLIGLDAVLAGDVPIGSGLSSSAAVEVAAAYAWQRLSQLELSKTELALVCQQAESDFVGVQCGIMDQYVSALGRRDHALLIDCRTLDHELVPLGGEDGAAADGGARIVVCDSGVRRGLVDSEYNTRREQCAEGVQLLRTVLPGVAALRDVSVADLECFGGALPELVRRRCRHVVGENQRVLDGVGALRRRDLAAFGELMYESHASLRDDFEVSCPELDALVEAAREVPGVYGSRLTGAGFGGCTVSLVADDAIEQFSRRVVADYRAVTGSEATIVVCSPDDGVGEG